MFNSKKVSFLTLVTLLLSLNVLGASSESISFTGQQSQVVELEVTKMVTLYKDELQDSTCNRQEPYTVNECGYETRTRRECRYRSGYNRCWDDTDRVCRYETRYRRSCSTGPSRRLCTTKPGRRNCRRINGQRVCNSGPSRQVCRNVPGREVCRQTPYQDRVCRNISRRVCRYEPGRDICNNVSYQEYICKDVVRYRNIPYACQITVKVPYQVEKNITHKVSVKFRGELALGNAEFTLSLNDQHGFEVRGTNLNKEGTYITFNKSLMGTTDAFNRTSELEFNFYDRVKIQESMKATSHKLWMNKGGKFSLTIDQFNTQNVSAEILVLRKKGKKYFHSKLDLSNFTVENLSDGKMNLKVNLASFGFKRIKTLLGTGAKLEVKIMLHTNNVLRGQSTIDSFKDTFSKEHKYKLRVYKNK